jgi:phosphoglycolate phosphatase-like HAD superfamily hydrolase
MRTLKTFIFDFDGTLFDTTFMSFKKVNSCLKKCGLEPVPINELRPKWGLPWDKLSAWILEYAGASFAQREKFIKLEKKFKYSFSSSGNDKIFFALKRLSWQGNLVAVVTSRTRNSFESFTDSVKFDRSVFQFVQTAEPGEYHKPDPRVFNSVINWSIKNGQADVRQMIYFGDTVDYDLAAVKNRPPMDFVGVVSGVNTKEEFLEAGLPESKITNFQDLPSYLERCYL